MSPCWTTPTQISTASAHLFLSFSLWILQINSSRRCNANRKDRTSEVFSKLIMLGFYFKVIHKPRQTKLSCILLSNSFTSLQSLEHKTNNPADPAISGPTYGSTAWPASCKLAACLRLQRPCFIIPLSKATHHQDKDFIYLNKNRRAAPTPSHKDKTTSAGSLNLMIFLCLVPQYLFLNFTSKQKGK